MIPVLTNQQTIMLRIIKKIIKNWNQILQKQEALKKKRRLRAQIEYLKM